VGFGEALFFVVFAFAGDFDAVIYHAAEDAGLAMHAEVFDYAYAVGGPVKCVGGACFDAEFALYAHAGVLVYGYGALGEEVFDFCGG
jgi:hypothetical protein